MLDLNLHLLLFTAAGASLLLLPLLIGRLLRPTLPTPEKDAVYECGEPTIGSSYIQFDLRFYVVALLFIIFDVEVAFFFPWAVVFGGARQLTDTRLTEPVRMVLSDRLLDVPAGTSTAATMVTSQDAMRLATVGVFDILVFFGVLVVGFAYVWKRGDLDWVRSMINQAREQAPRRRVAPPMAPAAEPVLTSSAAH
jgi:NADH-quinone oxidoreductase subunit A